MQIEVLKSKLHCVTVTEANLNYMGSITIDEDLMDAANLIAGEKVQIVDNNNGERLDDAKVEAQKRNAENAEAVEKRAKALKSGEKVHIEHRAVASSSTALGTVASGDITPAFEQVGTIDKLDRKSVV